MCFRSFGLLSVLMLVGCSGPSASESTPEQAGGIGGTLSVASSVAIGGARASTSQGNSGGATPAGGTSSTLGGASAASGGMNVAGGASTAGGTGTSGGTSTASSSTSRGGTSAAGGTGTSGGTATSDGTSAAGGTGTSGGTTTSSGTSATGGTGTGKQPLQVVFVFDRSASMGATGIVDNTATRWTPLKQGMNAFFASNGPATAASLTFFSLAGPVSTACQGDYTTPSVPMTQLTAPQPLTQALEAITPAGGTPTLSALNGGILYAKQLLTAQPGARTVVILVTDGEPAVLDSNTQSLVVDCAPTGSTLTNTITDVAALAHSAYTGTPSIVTHVIGVGVSLANMQPIATAGGGRFLDAPLSGDSAAFAKAVNDLLK